MRPASLDEVVGPGSPAEDRARRCGGWSRAPAPRRSSSTGHPAPADDTGGPDLGGHGLPFEALSALSAGVKEVRAVIDVARRAAAHGEQTVLPMDEVHRFSRRSRNALFVRRREPGRAVRRGHHRESSFSVVAPLLSRFAQFLQLQPLDAMPSAPWCSERSTIRVGSTARSRSPTTRSTCWCQLSAGDARRALTALEVAAEAGEDVTVETIEQSPRQGRRSATTATTISTTT